jgi:DNA ligase (NAD+)
MTREEAKEKLRKLGAVPHSDVFRGLDYLVVGKGPGSKLTRAKKLGVKIINEEEFLKMIK